MYRYTGNDPRTTLVSNGTSAEPTLSLIHI